MPVVSGNPATTAAALEEDARCPFRRTIDEASCGRALDRLVRGPFAFAGRGRDRKRPERDDHEAHEETKTTRTAF
jgi:hypothetical protein